MERVSVRMPGRAYEVCIGPGVLARADELLPALAGAERAFVIADAPVAERYLAALSDGLAGRGLGVVHLGVPEGEEAKSLQVMNALERQLATQVAHRDDPIVALGGGAVGDLAGFVAATYMRGVPFVQVPTTLLSQVDSSVGGKTGINHPLGKNMIGAFYQPQAVIADTSTLNTLPARELSAGLSEVIKHGAIIDPPFFDWIEANIDKLVQKDAVALAYAIKRSCEIKADVVRQDEREGGLRAILNFGHTFGHAIEAGMGYGVWLHGEAVGCGMVMAADLSHRLGFIDDRTNARIAAVVKAAGLPAVAPDLGTSRWLELMEVDKKNEGGQIKFILLKPLGTSVIMPVPQDVLLQTLSACTG